VCSDMLGASVRSDMLGTWARSDMFRRREIEYWFKVVTANSDRPPYSIISTFFNAVGA
jgi:hypothetical protein